MFTGHNNKSGIPENPIVDICSFSVEQYTKLKLETDGCLQI